MKMRSLTTMTFCCALVATTISTAAFAKPHCGQHRIQETISQVQQELRSIFASQNTVFAYEGALANPLSNKELEGIISAEREKLAQLSLAFVETLIHLGVPPGELQHLPTQANAFFEIGWQYASEVNGGLADFVEQQETANEWLLAASAIGETLANVSGDITLPSLFQNIVIRETELIQAYRGVLIENGVNPSDPFSEGRVAVEFDSLIARIADEIAERIVHGFCHK
jgi:hypothetical protein